jgi:uncharacterized Zn-finger protein
MSKADPWRSRLVDKSLLAKNHRGEWMILVSCLYCHKSYQMSAKQHGKSGKCGHCQRMIFIPYLPESLQKKCSYCGRLTLDEEDFCECGAILP